MENKWAYQVCLEKNKVENKFDNFLRFLTGSLAAKRQRARAVGALPSRNVKLDDSDCALVYNPRFGYMHPKIMLYSPLYFVGSSEDTPHLIMMAVIANLISDQDPEFDAFISKKIDEYLASFESERTVTEQK